MKMKIDISHIPSYEVDKNVPKTITSLSGNATYLTSIVMQLLNGDSVLSMPLDYMQQPAPEFEREQSKVSEPIVIEDKNE